MSQSIADVVVVVTSIPLRHRNAVATLWVGDADARRAVRQLKSALNTDNNIILVIDVGNNALVRDHLLLHKIHIFFSVRFINYNILLLSFG